MLTLLTAIVYGLTKKDLTIKKKIFIVILSSSVLTADIFIFQHYPYAGLVSFLMLIPVITYLIFVTTDIKNYKNELGFLTIIAVDAAIKLSIYLNKQ
jgi:hypothetical protein